jgi:hypothetical protein
VQVHPTSDPLPSERGYREVQSPSAAPGYQDVVPSETEPEPSVSGEQGSTSSSAEPSNEGLAPSESPPPAAADSSEQSDADADPDALNRFRPELDDYGAWIDDSRYGTVWVPYPNVVGARFTPYVNSGHWALGSYNQWVWVSDYPFGGVVFHYGRWVWIPGEGWAWVPGTRYAPAWVRFWVVGDSYLGWAPLGPSYIWRGGAVVWIAAPAPRALVFVPRRHVFARHVSQHAVHNSRTFQDLRSSARAVPVHGANYGRSSSALGSSHSVRAPLAGRVASNGAPLDQRSSAGQAPGRPTRTTTVGQPMVQHLPDRTRPDAWPRSNPRVRTIPSPRPAPRAAPGTNHAVTPPPHSPVPSHPSMPERLPRPRVYPRVTRPPTIHRASPPMHQPTFRPSAPHRSSFPSSHSHAHFAPMSHRRR